LNDTNNKTPQRDYSIEYFITQIKNHILLSTVILFLAIKCVILFVFFWLFGELNRSIGSENSAIFSNNFIFDVLGTRWDSYFYLVVAKNGGYFDPLRPTDTRIWNFGPLYPFFTRLLMDLTKPLHIYPFYVNELPVVVAGVLVSNLFSLTSSIAFFYMSKLYLDDIKAAGATLLFSFFPTVFVFSTVAYAEPVFITFVILSWYYFEKKKYPLSGLTLALATLARFPGALIFFLYIPIYIARKIPEKGFKSSLGVLLAIPLFPILVVIRFLKKIMQFLENYQRTSVFIQSYTQKIALSRQERVNFNKGLDFLDIGLSWVLIFGIIPFGWIIYANSVAPIPLSEITFANWGAKFLYPFAGFLEMIRGGNVKWTLEKYLFVFLFLGLGIIAFKKKPSFSLLIIGQTLFYTGYTGVHAWGAPRYTGTIFWGFIVLTEELKSNKMIFLVMTLFITYGFIVLWQFCNWDNWLI
jgi:4-amino-4-deoxy-L-arabinose transferase-like glycosyltransferase